MRRRAAAVFWIIALCLAMRLPSATAQQWHSMLFRADAPGIDENPLRGLVPFASTRQDADSFPRSMEWFYLPLSGVVTGPDTYDWTALEHQLTAIASRGHQAIFRFYVDYPTQPSGIPRYLLEAGLKTFAYDDSENRTSATPSVAPDYRAPRLIECMVHFIHAFGEKYDGDVRIAYLTAGLYGFWGEWHVESHPLPGEPAGWRIAQKDKDALLRAYEESFAHTPILVRQPEVTSDRDLLKDFGFHDDSFLRDTIGPEAWQFWRQMQRAGTTKSWQAHPTGGEIYPQLQPGLWDTWPNSAGQDIAATIQTAHVTWMLDYELFKGEPTAAARANALRAQRMLGYTFYCAASRVVPVADGTTVVGVKMENRGVAPMYAAWPVEVEAVDGSGKRVAEGRALWPLATLLPGETAMWSVVLGALPDTAKAIVLRIANPMPRGHDVAFANAGMGTIRKGWLTLNELTTAKPESVYPALEAHSFIRVNAGPRRGTSAPERDSTHMQPARVR